ncbi:MAG: hypothetical protein OK442_00555 [Thaumarchaeota archaeon]|nr:hypothetical protein [Nitrososphaerota archaeon]
MDLETMQDAARSAAGSGTPHYNVSCQSCRVSKTFVTMQGVNSFVMEHDGHMVIEGRLFESPLAAKKPSVVDVEAPKPQAEEASEVIAPAPEVDAEETAAPIEEVPEVSAESDEVHAQDLISPHDASEVFAAPEEGAVYGVEPRVEEVPEVVEAPDEVAAQEVIQEVDVQEEAAPMEVDVQELEPLVEDAPEAAIEPVYAAVKEAGPQMVERDEVAVSVESPAPPPQAILPAEVLAREPLLVAQPRLSEQDLKEPLLLARSSYIGESDEKRMDALKVSRALKEFKWNVEPPYVIGVMVDDNLSVETNIGVISTAMVARVEKLGYKFVAVNAPQGSPVAWFKKEAQDALGTGFPAGDPERMMQIHQGKRTYDGDKAVWEESFVSLLMSVKDMDGQKLRHVTEIIKSERPEPDIKS